MIRRARLTAVLAILGSGALLVIAATQTWIDVALVEGGDALPVSGAAAVAVLAPLGLAALALGLALTVTGLVVRLVLGVLATAIGVALVVVVGRVALTLPIDAVAGTVTEATGIAGAGVAALVAGVSPTPWPWIALAASVVLALAGVLVVATARRWARAGRRFDSAEAAAPPHPHDAVDSWDDLSRGADPTA